MDSKRNIFNRNDAISKRLCIAAPLGCGSPAILFNDERSIKEYHITALCQTCQDKVFDPTNYPNESKIRLVLYSSDLVKEAQVDERVYYGGHLSRVMAKSWGNVFLRLSLPLPKGQSQRYWRWSAGGGCGPSSNTVFDDETFKAFIEQETKSTQAYWQRVAEDKTRIIVGNQCYHDGGYASHGNKSWLGFGGRKWGIKSLITGNVWCTNNLWHNGTIPEELSTTSLVPTHEFIEPTDTMPHSIVDKKTLKGMDYSIDQAKIIEG